MHPRSLPGWACIWLVFYRGVLIQQCHVPITNVQIRVGSFARFQFPPLNGRPDSVCAIPHPLILRVFSVKNTEHFRRQMVSSMETHLSFIPAMV